MTVLMAILPGDICMLDCQELSAPLMFAWNTNGYSRLLLARLAGVWRAAAPGGGNMIVVIMQSAQQGIPAALSLRTGG